MPQTSHRSCLSQSSGCSPEMAFNKNELNKNNPQLATVMSQLNKLSQSFMHSYKDLEGQVVELSDQLHSESQEKQFAIKEKQLLLDEKIKLSDRLQNLLAIMPAGVVVLDGDGQVKDCNAMAVDLLGRPLLGELWVSVINRAFAPQADDGHQISLRDGRKIHIETKALDTEPGQLVLLTDMTKTRQLQAELSQQQKLSSMGKMIAFLAHQIRTPLSAAILYGSHLSSQAIESGTRKEFSENLMERLRYMERQITDMLNFVKGERKEKQTIAMNELRELLEKIVSTLPDFVSVDTNTKKLNEVNLIADVDALVGAISNLLENACQACDGIKDPKVKLELKKENNHIVIRVSDNGCGISDELQGRVFEPFCTTKSSGNGLGLAIVHGVVIEHGGKISVESSQGKGTCFTILLPAKNISEDMHPANSHQVTSQPNTLYPQEVANEL
ncbi:PAS domain-containing sensor histidine kinase [Aliikangiella sp. G2MR2-5]|uniref:sensor histidine kinase n=1 Tax=Aliikangiella sp. G2MR2-5 TaxID=2788943 RepID=UPI0018A91AD2|nr:ATP-binding protein [Aliikangiella sp. G2MR2-5]